MTDTDLPAWVRRVVESEAAGFPDGEAAMLLLDALVRHTGHMTRTYPDAWFAGGQKNDDAVSDLAHRTYTHCARTEKGRFPFSGRTPFQCFVEEQHDARAVRYHSVYAKLSIARELMRADYSRNLTRDPVLKWRADLYREVRALVSEHADELPQGRGLPPRWAPRASGLRRLVSVDEAKARLRTDPEADRKSLVLQALNLCGPLTASDLTRLLEAVLGAPAVDEPSTGPAETPAVERLALRQAVVSAWEELPQTDQSLLLAVVRGDPYADILESLPHLKNKVAVSRAVSRCGRHFLAHVGTVMGQDNLTLPAGRRPMDLLEPLFAVLIEAVPALAAAVKGVA